MERRGRHHLIAPAAPPGQYCPRRAAPLAVPPSVAVSSTITLLRAVTVISPSEVTLTASIKYPSFLNVSSASAVTADIEKEPSAPLAQTNSPLA